MQANVDPLTTSQYLPSVSRFRISQRYKSPVVSFAAPKEDNFSGFNPACGGFTSSISSSLSFPAPPSEFPSEQVVNLYDVNALRNQIVEGQILAPARDEDDVESTITNNVAANNASNRSVDLTSTTAKLSDDSAHPMVLVKGTSSSQYNYDVAVIGGSSSGLACARELKRQGFKVALVSYKCEVNCTQFCAKFGCFPKHLVHRAGELGNDLTDAPYYGWKCGTDFEHKWETLYAFIEKKTLKSSEIDEKELNKLGIDFYNQTASLRDEHTILLHDERKPEGQQKSAFRADKIVLCTGSMAK